MGHKAKIFLELVGGSGLIVAVTCLCIVIRVAHELSSLVAAQPSMELERTGWEVIWACGEAAVFVAWVGLMLTIVCSVMLMVIALLRRRMTDS